MTTTVAKICGADAELGNFITGPGRQRAPGDAAIALLQQIPGIAHRSPLVGQVLLPLELDTDRGRRFLPTNGGCAYIDLDHLEICLPEVASARDHVACWHAMLRLVRAAQRAASARLAPARVHVIVNNSDGLGSSYGSHLDFLITRRAWDDIFARKLHPLLFLAAYQASSIVFAGQGKVGSENGAPPVAFQISQRADFIETLVGPQTTFRRPLVNSRDEPHCGARGTASSDDLARLHVIAYDSTLSQTAHLLKVGVLQIVLAMIEAGRTSPALALDDPVAAIRAWSHDVTLQRTARLAGGGEIAAVGLQRLFVEHARAFVSEGEADEVVPGAREIFSLWDDTITRFESGDLETLARRVDWVLKLSVLRSVAEERRLDWGAPEMKHLDHLFASLDPDEGLFWIYEREGFVDRVVSEAEIQYFLAEPPIDTRAWTRARLLREAGSAAVAQVDWDAVLLRGAHGWGVCRIDLGDPRAHTRRDVDNEVWEGEHHEVS